MSLRRIALMAGGISATFLAALWLHAQDKPTSDKMKKVCLKCHKEFEKTLEGKKVHVPVKQDKCVSCHNPHAANDKHFLDDAEARLCAACHDKTKEMLAKKFVHSPIRNEKCSDCHEPHASATKGLLKEEPTKLCAKCHNQKEKFGQAVVHTPVQQGQCMTCHDPHASDHPAQAQSKMPDLCLTCHKDSAALAKSHVGMAVEATNCLMCHDPHSSTTKALLKPVAHYPVQQKECGACHSNGGALKKATPDLCFDCHAKGAKFVKDVVHKPVAEGKCTECHDPHAASEKKLLKRSPKEMCLSCHQDQTAHLRRKSVHAPFRDGDCTKCHEAHAGDHPTLTRKPAELELCESCHKRHGHPVDVKMSAKLSLLPNSKAKLNREGKVTCLTCHSSHAADQENLLLYDKNRDLCLQCHKFK